MNVTGCQKGCNLLGDGQNFKRGNFKKSGIK